MKILLYRRCEENLRVHGRPRQILRANWLASRSDGFEKGGRRRIIPPRKGRNCGWAQSNIIGLRTARPRNTNALPRPLPPTHPSSSVKGPGRMGAGVPIWKGPWGGVPPERGGVHSRSFLAMCENSSLLFFPRFETALARGGGTTRTPPNRYSMSVTCAPPLSLSLIAPLGGPLSLAWVVCVCMYGQGKAVCMQGRAAGPSAPLHE